MNMIFEFIILIITSVKLDGTTSSEVENSTTEKIHTDEQNTESVKSKVPGNKHNRIILCS